MHDEVTSSKFTTKPHLRKLFISLYHLHDVYRQALFLSLVLWKFVHDKIETFAIRKWGLVMNFEVVTSSCIRAIVWKKSTGSQWWFELAQGLSYWESSVILNSLSSICNNCLRIYDLASKNGRLTIKNVL